MKMTKKLLTTALMCAMLATSATAFAAETASSAGSAATSTAQLTATAATFSVTVPTTMPLSIAADGTVTESTEFKITNKGQGQIKVTAVTVTPSNNWSIVDFATDFKTKKVNLKEFGMKINGDLLPTTGNLALGSAWTTIDGEDTLLIPYEGNVAMQTAAFENAQIADVAFTVAWDSAE